MKNYYVYIYYRLDTNEPFYVGKGKDDRWKWLYDRSQYFTRIVDKYKIAVVIEKSNLTEQQAFYWEEKIIEILVFEYGYSIDIENNRSKEKGRHLVNCTWGGEGVSGYKHTEKWRKKHSRDMKGENNPMYGKNPRDYMTEETKEKINKKLSENFTGENNPMYQRDWRTGKTKEEILEHNKNVSKGLKGKEKSNIHKNNISKAKKKSIICLTTKRIFNGISDGANYYKISRDDISLCCRHKKQYGGKFNSQKLIWRFLIWKHNKKYRIK